MDVLLAAIREHGNAGIRWILEADGTTLWNAWGPELTALEAGESCEISARDTLSGNPVAVSMP